MGSQRLVHNRFGKCPHFKKSYDNTQFYYFLAIGIFCSAYFQDAIEFPAMMSLSKATSQFIVVLYNPKVIPKQQNKRWYQRRKDHLQEFMNSLFR